jgi:hypothetical protein
VDVEAELLLCVDVDALPVVTMIKSSMKRVLVSLRFVMTRVCWPFWRLGDV